MEQRLRAGVAATALAAFAAACSGGVDEPATARLQPLAVEAQPYPLPAVTTERLGQRIDGFGEISAFVLYQGGAVHYERYNDGAAADRPANIKSASKNIISALTGIARDRGYLASLDDPVSRYLPDYFEGLDADKQAITVRHLLTMSSGLGSTSNRHYGSWVVSDDWVRYALQRPLVDPPGTRMVYSTGDTHLLAAVLTAAAEMPLRTFAERYLFGPMDVHLGGWDRDPQGIYFGGNNMALAPRGLLAFGRLYLQEGRLNGERILSPDWVRESWQVRFADANFRRDYDYGYLWWRRELGGFEAWFAWGHGGQHLFVLPELDGVVVFTADPNDRTRGLNGAILRVMEETVVPWLYHGRRLRDPDLRPGAGAGGSHPARMQAQER